MSEEKQPPALGAEITISGKVFKVHHDCKKIRDALEIWLRRYTRALIDAQLANKEIGKEKHAQQHAELDAEIRGLKYVFGTSIFAWGRGATPDGIAQDLFERIKMNDPAITIEQVESWLNDNTWERAHAIMFEADGMGQAPKS